MSTHVIYQVVGRKVGCTRVPLRRRLKQQCERLGDYGSPHVVDGENVHEGNQRVEVLAVLTDVSDERASQVERAFARIYGYKPKQPYTQNWSAISRGKSALRMVAREERLLPLCSRSSNGARPARSASRR